jgi:hypothetical protein
MRIWILICGALLLAACEDVDLSTGPSGDSGTTTLVKMDNKSNYEIQVTIDACFQNFTLASKSIKTVECSPEDGESDFTVNMERPDFTEANWSGTVSQGQTVTILTDPWHRRFIDVEVDD